jgi:hypothetical protein
MLGKEQSFSPAASYLATPFLRAEKHHEESKLRAAAAELQALTCCMHVHHTKHLSWPHARANAFEAVAGVYTHTAPWSTSHAAPQQLALAGPRLLQHLRVAVGASADSYG